MVNPEKKTWLQRNIKAIIVVAIIIILGIVAFISLRGKNTVTGTYLANVKIGSIVCSKDKETYLYTEQGDNALNVSGRTIRIVGTFDETKTIKKVSLNYTVTVAEEKNVEHTKDIMHANLGTNLAKDELSFTEFDNQFAYSGNKITLSFFAPTDKIDEKNAPYLLLPTRFATENGYTITLDEFKQAFSNKKFNCVSTD